MEAEERDAALADATPPDAPARDVDETLRHEPDTNRLSGGFAADELGAVALDQRAAELLMKPDEALTVALEDSRVRALGAQGLPFADDPVDRLAEARHALRCLL